MDPKIALGISACLLGEKVRYDGRHKLDRRLRDGFGQRVRWVPVCPEVECGLPVPREPIHLVAARGGVRLETLETGVDLTGRMKAWARKRLAALRAENLGGFVFKARSPSCGLECVEIHSRSGAVARRGAGLWAAAFTARFPLLPVAEEGRLRTRAAREDFCRRVFALRRWRDLAARGGMRAALLDFHARHKLLLAAQAPVLARALEALLARMGNTRLEAVFDRYGALLARALAAAPPGVKERPRGST